MVKLRRKHTPNKEHTPNKIRVSESNKCCVKLELFHPIHTNISSHISSPSDPNEARELHIWAIYHKESKSTKLQESPIPDHVATFCNAMQDEESNSGAVPDTSVIQVLQSLPSVV